MVSDIDFPINAPRMKNDEFLKSSARDFILNINADYRYMKIGYYVSLRAEVLGNKVIPPSSSAIDAYRIPILLLRASIAGIPTAPHLVTDSVNDITSEFNFPVVVFPVISFSHVNFKVAQTKSSLYRIVKSLSMNYRYPVCAQPFSGEIVSFKSVFGESDLKEAWELAEGFYEEFKVPICRLYAQKIENRLCLCGAGPMNIEELDSFDLRLISERIAMLSDDFG